MTRKIALIVAVVLVLEIAVVAAVGVVIFGGGAPASTDWRDNCVSSHRLTGPDEGMKNDETGAKWVCDKIDRSSTIVITYADALGVSAEEQKDMSLDLVRAQGFGDDVVDDGPNWIEIER